MHYNLFCYIENFDIDLINNLPRNTSIIYRNYNKNTDIKTLINIKKICKIKKYKLYIANNIKLALKFNLDGVYIPAFNKSFKANSYQLKKNFKILGSAHNLKEIRIKELQKVEYLFLSPIFFTKKNNKYLGIYRFINLSRMSNKKIISLGGVKKGNIKMINLIQPYGVAGISLFKKKFND